MIEHVWRTQIEQAVEALPSFMRLLEDCGMKTHSPLGDALAGVTSGVDLGAVCVVEKYVEVIPSFCVLDDSAPELHLIDFSPLEFARQTTPYTSELFRKIRLNAFLKSTSNSTNGEFVNVSKVDDFTNRLNDCLSALLQKPDIHHRARIVELVYTVAPHCTDLHNYHTLLSICTFFDSSAIRRLGRTFLLLPDTARALPADTAPHSAALDGARAAGSPPEPSPASAGNPRTRPLIGTELSF